MKIDDLEVGKGGNAKVLKAMESGHKLCLKEVDRGEVTLRRLYVLDDAKHVIHRSPVFCGEYSLSSLGDTVFIWGQEFGSIEKYAYIWHVLDGELISIEQGQNPIRGGILGQSEAYWIQHYLKVDDKDATRVVIYGPDGKIIADETRKTAGRVSVMIGESSFSVKVSKPEFPY